MGSHKARLWEVNALLWVNTSVEVASIVKPSFLPPSKATPGLRWSTAKLALVALQYDT